MKSTLLAAIFAITGLVTILLAVPAEEKGPVIKIHPPKSFPDYGDPVVPQIEEVPPQEAAVPEPVVHYYSVAQAKTEKPAPSPAHACRPPAAKLLRKISYRFHQAPKTSGGEIIS